MNKNILKGLLRTASLSLLIAGIPGFNAGAQIYTNPLTGTIDGHDPCIIKSGSAYHLYASHGSCILHRTSANRTAWTSAGSAISNPGWFSTYVPGNTGDVWAPDISCRSGKYWLYYAVSTFGSNVSAIGLATTASASLSSASWTDQGMVIRSVSSDTFNCIDPNAFRDSDGSTWLLFGSFWTGIKMVRVDSTTGKPSTSTPTIYALATRTNTASGIEAPFLFRRGSYYYLFVSWDRCCSGSSSTYNIRFGRSAAITGPYLDTNGIDMEAGGGTLLWSGDTRWKGPGAQNVFIDNDTTFLVGHMYDSYSGGATTDFIRILYWTANGWPTLTETGIVSRVTSGEGPAADAGRNENRICRIVGPIFAVPARVAGKYSQCTVYDLAGKRMFSVTAGKRGADIRGRLKKNEGVYVVRFSR